MKILVLGSQGMAGHIITAYLSTKGHETWTLSRRESNKPNHFVADATDYLRMQDILKENMFDVVINAVGILNNDAEENHVKAIQINTLLPHQLVELTKNSRTKVIHISTDCVFSGKSGNYEESSLRDAYTFYGRSKALGEIENDKDLTFRTSIIGPDLSEKGIGLFNWFMKQDGTIQGYKNAYWSGVTTLTLAKAIEASLSQDLVGLYHLVNGNKINKFDLLCEFNKIFKSNTLIIESTEGYIVDKSLINTRTDFKFQVPSYQDMLIEMKEWITENQSVYKQYQ